MEEKDAVDGTYVLTNLTYTVDDRDQSRDAAEPLTGSVGGSLQHCRVSLGPCQPVLLGPTVRQVKSPKLSLARFLPANRAIHTLSIKRTRESTLVVSSGPAATF